MGRTGRRVFFTGNSHEKLISRAKPIFDASIPSGNALATQLMLRLSHITGEERYFHYAGKVLRSYYDAMESQPFGFAHLLCALDLYLEKPKEVVIVGEREDRRVEELLTKIHSMYQPNMTLQLARPDESLGEALALVAGEIPSWRKSDCLRLP